MMNGDSLKTITRDFKDYASDLVGSWLDLMKKKQYDEAGQLCIDFLEDYSPAFRSRTLAVNEDSYNELLILLVLFKGLHEYVQLCQITKNGSWHEDHTTVENVWIKFCDCRERLQFSSQCCRSEVVDRVLSSLNGLEEFFRNAFGGGSYFSPCIVADASLCNICNQDCRACSHVAGRLYNGKICSYKPINPQLNHVALVKTPKDLRCRIWSWHIKNNEDESIQIDKACILTSFSVDDFLQDSEISFRDI